MTKHKKLLFLTSFGSAYPNFDSVFREYNYQVKKTETLRKALSLIKQIKPNIILAEFVYAPTYGSQLSNFESLFAAAQNFCPDANFIAITHKDDLHHLEQVKANINNCQVLELPVKLSDLESCLQQTPNSH
jgi:hypothetical protein